MLYTSKDLVGGVNLNRLERLDESESNLDHVGLLTLKESYRLGKNILAIEDICKHMNDTGANFEDTISEVADIHGIDIESLAFSVKPVTLYLDEEAKDICQELQENQILLFLHEDYNSTEHLMVNTVCETCFEYYSYEPIDILEAWMTGKAVSGATNGAMSGAGAAVKDLSLGTANAAINGVKTGFRNGVSRTVDRNLFGTFLDTKDTNGKIVRNGRIQNIFGKDNVFGDIAGGIADQTRTDVSRNLVDKGQMSLRGLFNAISQKLGFYNDKLRTTNFEHAPQTGPQSKSFLQKIIQKLTALKNKILSRLRGGGQ